MADRDPVSSKEEIFSFGLLSIALGIVLFIVDTRLDTSWLLANGIILNMPGAILTTFVTFGAICLLSVWLPYFRKVKK